LHACIRCCGVPPAVAPLPQGRKTRKPFFHFDFCYLGIRVSPLLNAPLYADGPPMFYRAVRAEVVRRIPHPKRRLVVRPVCNAGDLDDVEIVQFP
jgi:hypothetical protein